MTVECCKPRPSDLAADKPTIVVEVLSPSNDKKEMEERLDDYRAILSVLHVAFVDHRRPYAEVWSRDGAEWRRATVEGMEGVLDFTALSLSVPFAEAYAAVELD